MKLFYKVHPSNYSDAMNQIKEKFNLVKQVDEAKTMLMPQEEEGDIELVSGMYNPGEDGTATIRVVLLDESLREFFDSVLGDPYRVK